jgi:hypothetical protein
MRAMLLQLCVFLAAGVVYPGEEENKPAASASQGTYQVQLTDGTVIQILSYRFQGNYVAFVTKDGANVAFRRGDIDLDTLPTETEPIPQDGPPPDSLGVRQLRDVATVTHLSGNEIMIVGDGTFSEMPGSSTYDVLREKALAQIEAVAERYSESAGKLTKNVLEYQNGCSGYTVTHHKGTTTGAGVFIGSGEAEYDNSWVGGTAGGSVNWGVESGYTDFTFEGMATWQEEHAWTSTSNNWDTPYCRGLWSEILAQRGTVEPALNSAIQTARLNFVLDSEINAVFLSYSIGPVGFWVPDLR